MTLRLWPGLLAARLRSLFCRSRVLLWLLWWLLLPSLIVGSRGTGRVRRSLLLLLLLRLPALLCLLSIRWTGLTEGDLFLLSCTSCLLYTSDAADDS